MNNVKGIQEEVLIWDYFERIFKNKYLSERYYDDISKDFYQLHMGSMIDYEYTSKFLELSRYFSYLKEEKGKIHRFISETYRDKIDFDEPK